MTDYIFNYILRHYIAETKISFKYLNFSHVYCQLVLTPCRYIWLTLTAHLNDLDVNLCQNIPANFIQSYLNRSDGVDGGMNLNLCFNEDGWKW